MKALTDCGCGMIGAYKTPWCELIQCVQGKGAHILHLWYKLKRLQEEIEKRSSYLGKFRRTEEAKHLLDLISMTTDEEDLFYPFAKAAMADVFDAIEQYVPKDKRAYLWDEGKHSITIPQLPDTNDVDNFTPLVLVDVYYGTLVGTATFDWSITDVSLYSIFAKLRFTCNNSTEVVEEEYPVVFSNNQFEITINNTKPAFRTTSVDNVELVSVYCVWKDPITYREGDWIDYNGKVYFAVGSGDANSMDALMETLDYRHSIHYLLAFPKDWNENMAEPLDTAIFEALVARIIYKWLQYAYPDESPRYLQEWEQLIAQVRRRCSLLFGSKIVYRIPRNF